MTVLYHTASWPLQEKVILLVVATAWLKGL